jgi:hypothetical protein
MSQFDRHSAIATLAREFPEVAEELQDQSVADLFHMQMHCFGHYVQRQIDAGNRTELARCYEWLQRFVLYGNGDVQNAVGVSVLEHLVVRDGKVSRQWALASMPSLLKQEYEKLTHSI